MEKTNKEQEMEDMAELEREVRHIPKVEENIETEVTTIAKEEERTGEKIETPPTPEELVAKSSMSIIMNRKHLNTLLPKLGKKAMQRVIMASMDLPAEGIKVKLVKEEEKLAFRLCQSIQRAMFTVMFYHTSEQIMEKHKQKINKEKEECQTDKEPTQNSQLDGSEKVKKESTSPQLPTESDKL